MVSSTDGVVAGPGCVGWRFDNTYARLPATLHVAAAPARVREPRVAVLNHRLADELGLDLGAISAGGRRGPFRRPGPAGRLAGRSPRPTPGTSSATSPCSATAAPSCSASTGRPPAGSWTSSSRGRGGRGSPAAATGCAALGPMLREYVISEAMAALGIPTTRSLAVVTTGEPVYRESVRRGAILTRVAASHIRVGTFEYAAALGTRRPCGRWPTTRSPATTRNWSTPRGSTWSSSAPSPTARPRSIARWQLVGFIHGVMNTDNMAISGETIDYGPCAFMNAYDPATVFSSIDHGGRYAYGNQPSIAQWNLARFAEALLPLLDPDPEKAVAVATEVLEEFPAVFERYWLAGMRKKLGLRTDEAGDVELVQALLDWMQKSRADFTNTFRDLSADGSAGRRPVSGPGLPGLVRPVAGAARPGRPAERLRPST